MVDPLNPTAAIAGTVLSALSAPLLAAVAALELFEAVAGAAAVAVRVCVAPHWNGAEVARTFPALAKYLATKESLALALPPHIIDFSPEGFPEAYSYVK